MILHGDLKPHNISVFESQKKQDPNRHVEICPVVANFGISKDQPGKYPTQQGILEYMSPEVEAGASKTIYSDIWAHGCCFAQGFVLLYSGETLLRELRKAIDNTDQ